MKTTIKSVLSRILSEREYREYRRSQRHALIALAAILPWFLGYALLLGSLSLLSNILGFTSLIATNIVILYLFAMNSRKVNKYDERVIGKPSKKENKTAGCGFLFIILGVLLVLIYPVSAILSIIAVFSSLTFGFIFIVLSIKLFAQRKRRTLRSWAVKLG